MPNEPKEHSAGAHSGSGRSVRFLNKRNTSLAEAYATIGACVGYRKGRWEARIAGRNLSDRRDPVAESEVGDAQYYRLCPRRLDASATLRF